MSVESLAKLVIFACEEEQVDYMMAGAFAYGIYGIPRSTKDVDVVISVTDTSLVDRLTKRLEGKVEFNPQIQFDTPTWGKRHVGKMIGDPLLQVELFELFDDPFVKEQFDRKVKVTAPQLELTLWVPTAEDVLVQKLRWARAKDLDDARDVLAIQAAANLDMGYVRNWCREHGSEARLDETLARIPDF